MFAQFFGHSICMRKKDKDVTTFVDLIYEKYNFEFDETIGGAACCSEERILYDLKKCKNLELAIIFHSEPSTYFSPADTRDYSRNNENDSFTTHLALDICKQDKARKNAQLVKLDQDYVKLAHKIHQELFTTPDLIKNRFYGALIQIDQYIKYKNIPTIHCVFTGHLPVWFSFSHGIVDKNISLYQYNELRDPERSLIHIKTQEGQSIPNQYYASYHNSDNAINQEGNYLIAEKLSEYIDSLI